MNIPRFFLLAVGLAVAGCATPIDQLDQSVMKQVQPGQSRSAVQRVLGKPTSNNRSANGRLVENYRYTATIYSESSASDAARDLKIRTVSIRYSPAEVVEETSYYESRTPAWFLMHTAYAGPKLPPEKISQIKIGTTTRAELEEWFGKPMLVELNAGGGLILRWFQVELGRSFINPDSTQGLHVLIDSNGVVRTFNQTDRGQERR